MELRHLRYFVMVAEERNVSRAAARLYVTQPAISRQLKDLEAELGVKLFDRTHTGIALTDAGQTLFTHAREILIRSQQAVEEVRAQAGRTKPLIVGYVPYAPASFLSKLLRTLARRDPEMAVDLQEMQPGEQIEALSKGAIDVALIGEPCTELHDLFEVRTVRLVAVCAVLPDDHALASRKAIDLGELAGSSFVGLSPKQFPGRNDFLRESCRKAGFEPKLRLQANSLSAALGMVASGRGVALMPADIAFLPHPDTVFVKISKPKLTLESTAVWRKADESRVLKLFVDTLCSLLVVE
jgi:LysR family transcriptional regulator, benzoate and cis,cis-muconate-responsive activator of ben and cat genes